MPTTMVTGMEIWRFWVYHACHNHPRLAYCGKYGKSDAPQACRGDYQLCMSPVDTSLRSRRETHPRAATARRRSDWTGSDLDTKLDSSCHSGWGMPSSGSSMRLLSDIALNLLSASCLTNRLEGLTIERCANTTRTRQPVRPTTLPIRREHVRGTRRRAAGAHLRLVAARVLRGAAHLGRRRERALVRAAWAV